MREVAGDRLARLGVEQPRPGTTLLFVRDADTGHELCDRISLAIADGSSDLVVDLSATPSVDALTLGVLRGAVARVRARGFRLRLVAGRGLRRRLEGALAGATVYGTREEALAEGTRAATGLRATTLP